MKSFSPLRTIASPNMIKGLGIDKDDQGGSPKIVFDYKQLLSPSSFIIAKNKPPSLNRQRFLNS